MMKDATNFMAETLNDVLSLQKVEEGKLELEYKLFSPNTLAMDVINNFR
jgi:signal transduction histidine kinase